MRNDINAMPRLNYRDVWRIRARQRRVAAVLTAGLIFSCLAGGCAAATLLSKAAEALRGWRP